MCPPVAFVGSATALAADLRLGDLVVASELRTLGSGAASAGTSSTAETARVPRRALPGAELLAAEIRRNGLGARTGAVASSAAALSWRQRAALADSGVLALDVHSAPATASFAGRPTAVVLTVAELSADRSAGAPGAAGIGGVRALGSLLGVRAALDCWARATGPHEVVLASPRSFCAGVERAIETVEKALERYGPPVYVRRQIVHNLHVVESLEAKGARFVEEIDDVPPNAVVVLAAHGVSPEVRRRAADRGDLEVIDATCPLVAKVHSEARRYANQGHEIVLIGHSEHEEVIGTLGEAPARFHVVETAQDVGDLDVDAARPVAYLTQTTLATDETAAVVAALKARFPEIAAPPANDICYATQNRQDAVRAIARNCDLLLVVGSENSSNTARLAEVAAREGCHAQLIEDASRLRLSWLGGVHTIGITAGASAPDVLVQEIVDTIALLGPVSLREERTTEETVRFALPIQVRSCQSRYARTSESLLTSSSND
ncbi:MAG: 4-hydroxy-3-methylbut-2-enyl diphosphate reductase [Acidimicrobiales bacterium]